MRSERRRLSSSTDKRSGDKGSPDGWIVHEGALARVGMKIPDETIDLVHADIVYGHVEMAVGIAKLAKRVLVDGGFLTMIAGHDVLDEMNAIARYLTLIAIGSYHLRALLSTSWLDGTQVHVLCSAPIVYDVDAEQLRFDPWRIYERS